ncbi:3-hydroxyacyl-CoA dehydrogenase [Candidatus Pacearchaeota archaeon]|nr:3-hydroxyacyl-CoA dehydrogenase [Candidatus Pacearchaeota archaeon]
MIIINVEIPEELKRDIKVLAAKQGKTFKKVVIESLAEKLEREKDEG